MWTKSLKNYLFTKYCKSIMRYIYWHKDCDKVTYISCKSTRVTVEGQINKCYNK